jgi:uncharacterized protein DUF4126
LDLASTLFSTGWAAGVNAYATVALLNLLGRAGVGEVPDALEGNVVLAVSVTMYAIEFVTDKVPYLDNVWDAIHTAIRPAIASATGAALGSEEELRGFDEALAAGGSGATALASHAVKASLRLGINASPEPASNIVASLLEDGAVGVVVFLALENPEIAALIAALLLAAGIGLTIFLWKRIRRAAISLRRRYGRGPPGASSGA